MSRYLIATEWGDLAEADTHEAALVARATLAADRHPEHPEDLRGITISIYADADELAASTCACDEPFDSGSTDDRCPVHGSRR